MTDITQELRETGIARRRASDLVDYAALKADYQAWEPDFGVEGGKVAKPFLARKFPHHATVSRGDILVKTAETLCSMAQDYLGKGAFIGELNHWYARPWPGERVASQSWHRDLPGAVSTLKVFIFYAPVDEDSGPFQYILGSRKRESYEQWFPGERFISYVPEAFVSRVLAPEDLVTVTCPEDTIVFCDTSGLHRGGYCKDRPRLSSTFGFFPPGSKAEPIVKICD